MKKIYHLKSCDSCRKILKQLPNLAEFELRDIKENPITVSELEEMKALSGSYESLFSRRAKLYKERGLKDVKLTEEDYKKLILDHYTFLSRPVAIVGTRIFIGNSPKTITELIS
ncbi:arsenate reductase family protein [Flavobacterium sp. JP2137]|uniref:arsenate reductase family protein n=1 Tax=Flavobacterium sp. JP2137 TaxID=3414510 RepID=UPI003D2FFF77